MTDIDTVLTMINNPTRRRILQALVREPHYPLQLSKELGVSQQAVMKNLDLLERSGMVVSHRETSTIGPMRTMYEPTTEFTLVIDMRGCMFTARMVEGWHEEDGKEQVMPKADGLEQVRKAIADLDAEIDAIHAQLSELMGRRERMISEAMSRLDGDPFQYVHRNLMYNLLNRPTAPMEEVAADVVPGRERMKNTIEEIESAMNADN